MVFQAGSSIALVALIFCGSTAMADTFTAVQRSHPDGACSLEPGALSVLPLAPARVRFRPEPS